MSGVLRTLAGRLEGATWITLVLLGLALGNVALGLSQSVRGLDLELLATMVLVGACIGGFLARTRVPAPIAFPLALVLAIVAVFVRVGQLGDELVALAGALINAFWAPQFRVIRTQGIVEAIGTLQTATVTLLAHLQTWLTAMVSGQPVQDIVGLALIWGLLLLVCAAWAAWMVSHGRAFLALTPLVVLFALVNAYTGHDAWLTISLMTILLALVVVVPYAQRERRWAREKMPAAQDLGFDLAFIAVAAIAGVMVVAALAPAFSPREIARWVEQWSRPAGTPNTANPFTNSLGLVPAPRPPTLFDTLGTPGLPRSHLLGAAPELLRRVALDVQTNDPPGVSHPYYWLGSTYDVYTGHGWLTRDFQTIEYGANENAPQENFAAYRTVYQTVHVEREDGLVYAAGSVASVDHDFELAVRGNEDLFAAKVRVSNYRAASRLVTFTPDALRQAGETYPQAVRDSYLALPQNIPPRVLALARDLTATAPTPYDRALAIQEYLRTFPYTLDLPAPPAGRDVVDYFLFDLKRGYCDYYATAMAVLARAAGLPARVAVGYATGDYSETSNTYRVTEADAHSWTQIYFPEYGWIDFEPTSARSLINYNLPEGLSGAQLPVHGETESNSNASVDRVTTYRWLIVPGVLLVLGALALLFVQMDGMRLRRLPADKVIAVLYSRIFRLARNLGLAVTESDTPDQVALLLQDYFEGTARTKRLFPFGQAAVEIATQIVSVYVETTYGAYPLPPLESEQLIQRWQDVQWQLRVAVFEHLVQSQVGRLRQRMPRA